MDSVLARVARSSTAPLRNYFNSHFEMVKDEVRRTRPAPGAGAVESGEAGAWRHVAELENTIAESSLYQARVVNRLSDDVHALVERIAELERIVAQLAAIAAASTTDPS